MIELHFHCLPGIDDGPNSWEEALALCREAASQGATHIVATPHVLRDPWINDDRAAREALVSELNARLGGTPVILPGCEYFFSSDAAELWEAGDEGPLVGLARSAALLVEFGPEISFRVVESVFHELAILGVVSVIAHPERHAAFSGNLPWLASLVDRGARVQVTASGVAGDFGARSQTACDDLFEAGLVHFVASDAHSLSSRPPRLAAARARAERVWGPEAATGIFDENPRALLAGEPLPWLPEPTVRRKS